MAAANSSSVSTPWSCSFEYCASCATGSSSAGGRGRLRVLLLLFVLLLFVLLLVLLVVSGGLTTLNPSGHGSGGPRDNGGASGHSK